MGLSLSMSEILQQVKFAFKMENGDRAFYWDNDIVFPDSLTEELYCGGFWLCVC